MIAAAPGVGAAEAVLGGAGIAVVLFFVVLHTATAARLIAALPALWRHWDVSGERALARVLASDALPTVSVVVTGRATPSWTAETVRSLLALRYPRHEVVLVLDGEHGEGLRTLIDGFDLYQVPPAVLVNVPTGLVRRYYRSRRHGKLFVIDKARDDQADDLNAALNASRFPYVLTMDVGTRLAPDALTRLMRPFLLGERIAAVAASVRIAGDVSGEDVARMRARVPSRWLSGVQAVEGLRELTWTRIGRRRIAGQLPPQGGVMLHRREFLLEIDGYRPGRTDPELDLLVRLRAHLRDEGQPNTVAALSEPVAWALAPSTARATARRIGAMQRGRLEELALHRASAADGRHQSATRRIASAARFAVALAPFMELAGYLLLAAALVAHGARDPFAPLFLLAVPGYALLLSLWAIALEAFSARQLDWGDLARLGGFALAEQLGYRQWAMWTRLRATWSALRGGVLAQSEVLPPPPASETVHPVADEARAR